MFLALFQSNGFYLLFSDIHIWSVVIGVLLNNYVFQDGKSNYFQGMVKSIWSMCTVLRDL